MSGTVEARLEYLRGELRAERISYGELAELQSLAEHIPAGDIELLEAAGVPEFGEESTLRGWVCMIPLALDETDDVATLHDVARVMLECADRPLAPGEIVESAKKTGECTGWLDRRTGTIQHDDDTCPIHEGGAS